MSLGCINTVSQSGILQVLWECESPFYKKKLIFTPTQSQTLLLDLKLFGMYLPPRHWQSKSSGSHKSCLCVWLVQWKTWQTIKHSHLAWECLEKHTLQHCIVHPEIDGGDDDSSRRAGNLQGEMCCGVKLFWLDWQIQTQLMVFDFIFRWFVCCVFSSLFWGVWFWEADSTSLFNMTFLLGFWCQQSCQQLWTSNWLVSAAEAYLTSVHQGDKDI